MLEPSEAGILMDGTSAAWPNGNVTLYNGSTASFDNRHGVNVAYCDGHVDSQSGTITLTNETQMVPQAMYMAAAFNWINNPGAMVPSATWNGTSGYNPAPADRH